MCDLFQANPWKPLLCTNCHQNRSGHQNLDKCNHPSAESSMHLYEEIMAQYFTTNIEITPPITKENEMIENDEDSFSDEEQDLIKPTAIEFIPNQSMISTQGIVLIGPDLRAKEVVTTKKTKKINLLKKSKSNADECLKKAEILENNSSKLWWFKLKKVNAIQTELPIESNKPNITSPSLNHQKVRVLPEMNKLTLNEALNIARRQHLLPNREPKLPLASKSFRSPGVSNYGASIASTTSSSSTQSSTDYDPNTSPIPTMGDSTYLTAVSPVEKNVSLVTLMDKTHKLTIERLTNDLRVIIDEYKRNLPVARFQTLKSFLEQDNLTKILSNDASYFLLLQILDDHSNRMATFDHFLIAYHSTIPILVPTTVSAIRNDEESVEEFIQNLAKKLFDASSLPAFNDLSALKTLAYRYFYNQMVQTWNMDLENNISMQRVQLLDFFWNKIQSLRHVQINEENERSIFTLYYLMRFISQSDLLI